MKTKERDEKGQSKEEGKREKRQRLGVKNRGGAYTIKKEEKIPTESLTLKDSQQEKPA